MCLSLIDVEMFTAACVCTLYNHFLPIKSSRSIAINAMILHTLILGWLLEQVFVKEPICDHLRLLNKRTAVVRNLLTYRMGDGKPNVMFVLGGPGAGKGTQCARSARFHCTECFLTWPLMKMSLNWPPPG